MPRSGRDSRTALIGGRGVRELRVHPVGRRIWAVSMAVFLTYAYGIETVQALRGLDPRFSQVGGPLDQALGGLFLLDALFITGLFVVLAVKYFRAPANPVVVGVRYGALASFIGFGVGIWMSIVNQGREVGEAGNLLVLHAAGFHGIQAVPPVALLLQWAQADSTLTRQLVHVAGLTWLGACLAIAWQSGTGGAIAQVSGATIVTALCLLAFGVTAVIAARAWTFSATYGPAPGKATA